ncbi:RNA polymerase sigma factor [Phenylobacterium sp.]|jgi:RNA polymerase sigma factor (sigma-70 family)|uniref:RNA polymerase sigma factor n=1 Tax=Phenylobacterium sp. TaxID=1871053 RepID=UPI0037849067
MPARPTPSAPQALRDDFRAWDAALRRYFRRRAPAGEVDDLVQEVFASLQARKSETVIVDMQRYLFVVARHVLVRRAERQSAWVDPSAEFTDDTADGVGAERILIGRQSLALLTEAIAGLPPRTRQVFILHRFEEMTYRSIASELGISISAVEKHIMIALRALIAVVGDET